MLLTEELHHLHGYVTNIIKTTPQTNTHAHKHNGWHAVTSLSASLQHMTSAANDHLY